MDIGHFDDHCNFVANNNEKKTRHLNSINKRFHSKMVLDQFRG